MAGGSRRMEFGTRRPSETWRSRIDQSACGRFPHFDSVDMVAAYNHVQPARHPALVWQLLAGPGQ